MKNKSLFDAYYLKINFLLWYYRYFKRFENVSKNDGVSSDFLVKDFHNNLKDFNRLVIVAGGPSSNNLELNDKNLFFATNSSVELVKNYHFIYYVTERRFFYKYLKTGFSKKNCLGAVFRYEFSEINDNFSEVKFLINYKKKYKRSYPEILISNYYPTGLYKSNFFEIENFFNDCVGIKFKSFNSGFSTVCLGYYLANKLQIPMDIYGMDFGEGGEIHFDGTPMPSRSVVGERVKRKYADLYNKFHLRNLVEITNYSNFDPLDY